MKKPCKYVLIPTDENAQIFKEKGGSFTVYKYPQRQTETKGGLHLYIISDEAIAEDDWTVLEVEEGKFDISLSRIKKEEVIIANESGSVKVIASTNRELTKGWMKDNDPERKSTHTDLVTMRGIPSISKSDIEYIVSLYNGEDKAFDFQKQLAKYLDSYVKSKHTQEECIGFIDGFTQRQILQDNTDKKFTLEDIRKAMIIIAQKINTELSQEKPSGFQVNNFVDDYIKSLTKEQPKSNTVMMEYEENSKYSVSQKGYLHSIKPKLKDGNIIIVKD